MDDPIEGLVVGEVHPPDLIHDGEPIVTLQCDTCKTTWPCHIGAWGYGEVRSRCAACRVGSVERIT